MTSPTLPRRSRIACAVLLACLTASAACGDSPTAPSPTEGVGETLPPDLPATGFTRSDLTPSGTVTDTKDGYVVDGELTMDTSDSTSVVFHGANVQVHFDESGRVTGLTGTVEIPSPSDRITFADPVRAQVGLFHGSYLNQQGDLGILVDDDTDYFVYDVSVSLQMNIATGETGGDAVKPVVVKAPLGGRILMVVDYTDPMYYTFGSQDLLGSSGVGWSLHHRIPFRPANPVQDLGAFEGGSTRVGSMSFFKILSLDGQLVDNEYTEVHLERQDPMASSLRKGYQAGFNGDLSMDLFMKDVVGIDLPVASATGGVWIDASTDTGIQGHVYARGRTTEDYAWWPTFIPARPVTNLDVDAFVKSDGAFEVGLKGEYGWDFPAGRQSMAGTFLLRPDSMTLQGTIKDGDVVMSVGGRVRSGATTLYVQPPQALLDSISNQVNAEILPRIDDAQTAWENLKKATADYEFELSLRGLRSSIPNMVDVAKSAISKEVSSVLASQKGKIWYNDLRSKLSSAVRPYYDRLDALKAAAQDIHDNQQTRDAIEAALRSVAAHKTFSYTYKYKVAIVGTLYSRTVTVHVLTDTQAAKLLEAADNVKYIKETSDRRVSMQQIYDQVDDKALFEQVRDDVQNGVVKIRAIDELGVVCKGGDQPSFTLYATIDGTRHEAGNIPALNMAELLARLPAIMIDALKSD